MNKLAQAMSEEFAHLSERFPRFASFGFGVGKGDEDSHLFPVVVEDLDDAAVAALFYYGRRMYNDNWNSSDAKKEGKPQQTYFDTWITEVGVTRGLTGGGGGGGARRDAATQGWISYLTLIGHKEAGGPVNGKTLARAQENLARVDLLKARPELKGKDKENERIKAMTAYLPEWIKTKEADPLLAGMIGLAAGKAALKE